MNSNFENVREVTMSNKEKRNNVQAIMKNGMIPIVKWKIYDRKYELWRGEIMPMTKEQVDSPAPFVLFRRPERDELGNVLNPKDIDKYIHDECKLMTDLFGVSVLLVAKENIFCIFGKESIIITPPPQSKIIRRPQ